MEATKIAGVPVGVGNGLVTEACAAAARSLLTQCISPWGLAASGHKGGYHNLWARDSMITALGILADGDEELCAAVRTSLCSLAEHQTEIGLIPNKIDFGDTKRVNFRAYADGGLWFALVAARYAQQFPSDAANDSLLTAALRALEFYRYQDHDRSGLISIDEGSTWMDLFPLRGKSTYINALRYQATRDLGEALTARLANEQGALLSGEAAHIAAMVNEKLWYEPGKDLARNIQDSFSTSSYDASGYDSLGRKLLLPEKKLFREHSYYLAYLTLRDFGEWFDTFGNLITITSGIANSVQQSSILRFLREHELAVPYPVRAMHPPLRENDADWRYYFQFGDLNTPEEYHNGGSWPMIGGWYVCALVAAGEYEQAVTALEALAWANQNAAGDGFSFHEHRHGRHGMHLGMEDQAWSAGAFLLAYHAVKSH